jgi:hypothetical protein
MFWDYTEQASAWRMRLLKIEACKKCSLEKSTFCLVSVERTICSWKKKRATRRWRTYLTVNIEQAWAVPTTAASGVDLSSPPPVDGSVGAHGRCLAAPDRTMWACPARGHQLAPIRKHSRRVPGVDQHVHAWCDYVRTTATCSAENDCRKLSMQLRIIAVRFQFARNKNILYIFGDQFHCFI